jgi:hypothetical protein
VSISGDGVFQQVPVALGAAWPMDDGTVQVTWPPAPGLQFRIEWSSNMPPTSFDAATNLIGTSLTDAWLDAGATNRPTPSETPQRYYRLKASP